MMGKKSGKLKADCFAGQDGKTGSTLFFDILMGKAQGGEG
jgi:hypothetical protein